MDSDDLQPHKKLPAIVLGEDISALSAHELEKRIARLEEEIARCTAAIKDRPGHQIRGGKFLQEMT